MGRSHFSANVNWSTFIKNNDMGDPKEQNQILTSPEQISSREDQTTAAEAGVLYDKSKLYTRPLIKREEMGLFAPLNISIFDKLGRPARFHRPTGIGSSSISHELSMLRKLMLDNRIQLMVSSPNITDEELFRFLTGDFMDIRIMDDGSPLFHCFMYDEYRPDPFFVNEQAALNRCIRLLLDRSLPCTPEIYMDMFTLNEYGLLERSEALELITSFKQRYDDIVTMEINLGNTAFQDDICEVTGTHATGFIMGNKCLLRTGRWYVQFGLDQRAEWKIKSLRIEDVDI